MMWEAALKGREFPVRFDFGGERLALSSDIRSCFVGLTVVGRAVRRGADRQLRCTYIAWSTESGTVAETGWLAVSQC